MSTLYDKMADRHAHIWIQPLKTQVLYGDFHVEENEVITNLNCDIDPLNIFFSGTKRPMGLGLGM